MLTPLTTWQKKLKEKVSDGMKKLDKNPLAVTLAYQDWIGEVGKGMEVAPLYKSQGTGNKAAWAPFIMPPPPAGNPATVAQAYALAWFSWYMAIQWSPHSGALPLPAPPFQVIAAITSSPVGAATQQAALIAKFTALFAVPSKQEKFDQIAANFYAATLSAGVMISGMSIPSPTPVPIVIPQWPIL